MLGVVDAGTAFLARRRSPSDDYLMRARGLVELAIHRRRAEGMLETRNAEQEIERLLRPSVASVLVESHRYDPTTVLGRLVETLSLEPTQADLLAVLLASETDPAIAQLIAYLGATTAPTVDVLFEIVYRPRTLVQSQAAMMLHRDLAPDALVRRLRFLQVDGTDARPFLLQTVRMAPRLTSWLLGRRDLDPELATGTQLVDPRVPDAARAMLAPTITRAVQAFEQGNRLLVLDGARGSGRELAMHAVACQLGRRLLVVDGRRLAPQHLVVGFREATLQHAIMFVRDAEELFASPEARQHLAESLAVTRSTIAVAGLGASASAITTLRSTVVVEVATPPRDQRLELWRALLPGPSAMTKREWRELAGLYNLGVGGIDLACTLACEAATTEGVLVGRPHVARAVRTMLASDLDAVATRVEVSQQWSDLVLPTDVMESVRAVTDRIAYRNQVFGDWGFARKVGKGLGLTALFSGPPGTGKSMVAGLIARELGLELYVIDLSRVTSKWIGETEKNLARAFDAAEAGHAMLLFDEADTILGKRTTEIRTSNDRNANLETNYVLARLEQFSGIAIFTTNIASAIDPAILRRMSANLVFPAPDADARAELWQRMLPAEAPVAGDLDFMDLAQRYELSGGYIRNAVLRAAFLAARDYEPISAHHLERAVRGEYRDRGALSAGGRLA